MDGPSKTHTEDDKAWRDITYAFKSSANQLSLGELIHSDHFTLFEAMSAIEFMDPRMDWGMSLQTCNRKILNFDQAIKSGQIKINNLEPNELIGIIDDTYSCLVSWLDGHHLAQTVMTNLYLHGPEKIEDRCLRIFSFAALKLTKFIDTIICEVLCVEEEDFQLNMMKFPLDLQVTDQKVLNLLDDLCQFYEKSFDSGQNTTNRAPNSSQSTNNNCNTNGGFDKQQINPTESLSHEKTTEKIDKQYLGALICRLRFSHHFYACFYHINRSGLKNSNTMVEFDKQTDAQISKAIKLVQSAVLLCDQHLDKCLSYLEKWNETIDLGVGHSPDPNDISSDAYAPTIMGFEPFINHKLLPPAYPRCLPIKTRPSTIVHLRDLIVRMRQCISISASFYQKSIIKSLNLIENFSKYFQPRSCVLSRSFLQILYLPGASTKLMRGDLVQSMLDFCEPLGQLIRGVDSNQNIFLEYGHKAFSQVVSIYGHNPARQHERFTELIATFKNLQYESAFVNSMAYSWTTYHLARLCIKYVLSSLELELFSAHEYPQVFWYLYEILYKIEREQLELARQFMANQLLAEEAQKKAKGKKSRKRQSKTAFHESELLRNDAYRFLAGGTFLLTHGLKLHGKIRTPSMDFTSEEICFDHRFGSLTGTSVYQSYKLTLTKLENLEHIYREALDCFSEAREIFSILDQHEDCLKVCKANMVVTKILSSHQESFENREVDFNFDTHPSFPTVKFVSE